MTQRFRIAKMVPFWFPRWLQQCPSWNSSNDILSQTMSDWAETWWEALEWHRDLELLKSFRHGRHLEIFIQHVFPNLKSKPYLLLNGMLDWAKTWWGALGWHGDWELLKSFCCDIHNGRHSSSLEDLLALADLELCSRSAYAMICLPWSIPYSDVRQ